MSSGRIWTDFTYLFRTHKPNKSAGPEMAQPNPEAVERRRRLEALREERERKMELKEVWD